MPTVEPHDGIRPAPAAEAEEAYAAVTLVLEGVLLLARTWALRLDEAVVVAGLLAMRGAEAPVAVSSLSVLLGMDRATVRRKLSVLDGKGLVSYPKGEGARLTASVSEHSGVQKALAGRLRAVSARL